MKITMQQIKAMVREAIEKNLELSENPYDKDWIRNGKDSRPESFASKAEKYDMTTPQFTAYVLNKSKNDEWHGSPTTVNQAKFAKSAAKVARTRDNSSQNEAAPVAVPPMASGLGEIEFPSPKTVAPSEDEKDVPGLPGMEVAQKITGPNFKKMVQEAIKKEIAAALKEKNLKAMRECIEQELREEPLASTPGTSALELSSLPQDRKFMVQKLVRAVGARGKLPYAQIATSMGDEEALKFGMEKGLLQQVGMDVSLTGKGQELAKYISEMIAKKQK